MGEREEHKKYQNELFYIWRGADFVTAQIGQAHIEEVLISVN